MMQRMRSLEDVSVNGKRVLVRVGLDVPMSGGQPSDTYRLEMAAPTIHFLINRFAKVILIGHLGRPKGQVNPDFSLRPVYEELSRILKLPIRFSPQFVGSESHAAIAVLQAGEILGLENSRFDKGEDDNSRTLACQLATYGDLFVNDALSAWHPAVTTVGITEFLPSYAGLLLEREYQVITNLMRHPTRPLLAVIGGAKISDKLPVIKELIKRADTVIVGGAVANTFLLANGVEVKKSLVDQEQLSIAKDIIKQARGKLILPTDYLWSDDQILDIGPKTIKLYQAYIKGAKTIFWNGNLGKSEDKAFAKGSEAIAKAIAQTDGTTVLAGGNTIEIASRMGLIKEYSFVSTAGSATLELLAGRNLPAISALG